MKFECVVIATKTNNREDVPYVEVYEYNCQADLDIHAYGHRDTAEKAIKRAIGDKVQSFVDQGWTSAAYLNNEKEHIQFRINTEFHGAAIFAEIQNLSITDGKVHTLTIDKIRNADKASTSGGPSLTVEGMGKFN